MTNAQHIDKRTIRTLVQTTKQMLIGNLYKRPMIRLKDEFNTSERFIAMTDVEIVGQQQKEPIRLVLLNRDEVVWVAPLDPFDNGE